MEIEKNESETVEFKESTADTSSILESICAFLNKKGGKIYIGIKDNGERVGTNIGKNTIENISNMISQNITPTKYPSIDVIAENERSLIIIHVNEGDRKPYFYKGRAFVRLGKNNILMDANAIEIEFKKRLALENRFEDNKTDISIKDYSNYAVDLFYSSSRASVKKINIDNLFVNLKLQTDGKFIMAGLICFGKNLQAELPQFAFRCGIIKKGQLISIDLIEGNLFELIEKTFEYAQLKMGNRFEIKGTKRKTIYDYPLEAVREAIINSLIHRDINFPSSNYLAIYEDHLEIKNPGQLLEGVTLEQLKEEHPSVQRNRKIANVAYLANYIEHWGTGTKKMVEKCRESGLSDPEFLQESGFFKVIFWQQRSFSNPRYAKALEILNQISYIDSTSYAKKFGVSVRMARLDLAYLTKQGFLQRKKSGRKVTYILK